MPSLALTYFRPRLYPAPLLLCSALLMAQAQAQSLPPASAPTPVPGAQDKEKVVTELENYASSFEMNWSPVTMPTGQKTAFLGASYMVALDEDWAIGPAAYGAAQGEFGGLFTVGFNVQRRWRISKDWHAAASLYAGAGGGVSSDRVRAGGGLMLRPELSLRREFGDWYAGVGISHITFPNGRGNIKDTGVTFTVGLSDRFLSFAPSNSGSLGRSAYATGMGFDELSLSVAAEKPRSGSFTRSGEPLTNRKNKAGADLRRYFDSGTSWWGIEASGAASGGHDGYMEILGNVGKDWGIGSERLRLGVQASAGLGGGGNMDTGSGWLLRVGPTLRWITPWGPTFRLDAGYMKAPFGHYNSLQVRGSLAVPLEKGPRIPGNNDPMELGRISTQTWFLNTPHFKNFVFKDGSRESVTGLGLGMTRSFGDTVYGVGYAGSAALGKAGAFSYGMFGLGAQTPKWNGLRFGAEALVGAAGGGGVQVGGGAVSQGELWAQWEGGSQDRLRVRVGVGQWKALGGNKHSTPMVNFNIGWAFGTLGPAN